MGMSLGINRGLALNNTGGAGGAWTPAALGAALMGWWEWSDKTTAFQDLAAATPVVNDGDPIRRLNDKSSNNRNILAPSDSARFLWKTSGGFSWGQPDGVNDAMAAAFTVAQPFTRVTCVQINALASGQIIGGQSANAGALFFSSVGNIGIFSGSVLSSLSVLTATKYVITEVHNGASSSLQLNNNTAITGNAGTFVPGGLTFGSQNGSLSNFTDPFFYSSVMVAGTMASGDLALLKTYIGAKGGVTV